MGGKLYEAARRERLKLSDNFQKELVAWYAEQFREVEQVLRGEASVESKADFWLVKLVARLGKEETTRDYVRQRVQRNLGDLLLRLNDLIGEVRKLAGKPVLVVVDGMDKVMDLKQALSLFHYGANALLAPSCKTIYTFPLALCSANEFGQVQTQFTQRLVLPGLPVLGRDGKEGGPGVAALVEALYRRVVPGLVGEETARRLAILSGGLYKQFMSLGRDAVLFARGRRGDMGPVQSQDVEDAARDLRDTYRRMLTEDQYKELCRIYRGGRFLNSPVAQDLIHSLRARHRIKVPL